jgi:hypothetical protein
MAIWEVRSVQQYGDRFWENIWHVDIGTDTDVDSSLLTAIEDFAVAMLLENYSVARIVRRPAGSTDAFIEFLVGAAGARALAGHFALPLFNTVRILLGAGIGRPGIKYLRGLLQNADIIDEQNHIDPALISYVNTHLDTLLNAATDAGQLFVVGAADKAVATAAPDSSVEMRQLHRKRKKTV